VTLTYSLITPVRDEEDNVPRLAEAVINQTVLPYEWVLVDNGSSDATCALVRAISAEHDWVHLHEIPGERTAVRGRPIVRALHAGIESLVSRTDVVVCLDADVSFEPTYFARLLACFEEDPGLGIASGTANEFQQGRWTQRHITGSTVWGATRAYRRQCLEDVLPFTERMGWDGVDEFKANARGWRTRVVLDLPFYHHRPEGARDVGRFSMRFEQGRMAHFTGYRPLYLLSRTLFHVTREPAAIGLIAGYASAALRHEERIDDEGALKYVRRQQRFSALPLRLREARGRRP
jgi:poly-beta-1,6-N-acetyl-D-glucosamine synthase